jgi:phosphoserine phosphatase
MQQNDRALYIFDLDGTLALIEHRRHLVEAP